MPCMEFVPESGPAVECLVSAERGGRGPGAKGAGGGRGAGGVPNQWAMTPGGEPNGGGLPGCSTHLASR